MRFLSLALLLGLPTTALAAQENSQVVSGTPDELVTTAQCDGGADSVTDFAERQIIIENGPTNKVRQALKDILDHDAAPLTYPPVTLEIEAHAEEWIHDNVDNGDATGKTGFFSSCSSAVRCYTTDPSLVSDDQDWVKVTVAYSTASGLPDSTRWYGNFVNGTATTSSLISGDYSVEQTVLSMSQQIGLSAMTHDEDPCDVQSVTFVVHLAADQDATCDDRINSVVAADTQVILDLSPGITGSHRKINLTWDDNDKITCP